MQGEWNGNDCEPVHPERRRHRQVARKSVLDDARDFPGEPQHYEEALQREQPGWIGRLLGKKAPVRSDPGQFVLGPDEAKEVFFDKAWHGLHYLLTKTAWEGEPPLDFLINGGHDIDEANRAFEAAQVAAIDAALRPIDTAWLRSRFDPADMDRLDMYPFSAWSSAAG